MAVIAKDMMAVGMASAGPTRAPSALAAAQESTDTELKTRFQNLANQHKQNYTPLLGYLH